jgi:glycine hydroxymethyltransferase
MKEIAYFINSVVDNRDKDLGGIREKVIELCHKFPLYK